MTQNAELEVHDQPLSQTWEGDWARAQEQAETYEEARDEGEDGGPSRSSEESTEPTTTSGGEGHEETGGEPQPGEESTRGEERDDGGQRDASQPGRVRRERVPEEVDEEPDDERATAFKAEAEALGYTIEDRGVTKQDRVSLRQERREMREKLAGERQEVVADLEQRVAAFEEQYGKATALQKAVDSDDLDAVATALGFKDWTDVNTSYLNKTLSPEHKELTAIKKQLKAREEQDAKVTKTAQERRAQEAQSLKEKEYLSDLADDIGDLEDEHLAAFSTDPSFISGVFSHQREHWDGVETITTKQAAELAYKDAKGLFDKLSKYFGGQSTETSETNGPTGRANTETTRNRRKAPKTVSQRAAVEASPADETTELDDKAWAAKWSKRMDEAHRNGDER